MPLEDDIKNALGGLLGAIDSENKLRFNAVKDTPAVAKAVKAVQSNKLDEFHFALIYPFEQMVEGLLSSEIPRNDAAQFLFQHSQFVECHIQRLIRTIEGSPCCADKSRTVMASLLRFFRTGEEISFNYEQEYIYHLPKTVFTTHEEIVTFFHALHFLYYGNPERYLQAMHALMTRVKAKN